MSGIMEERRKMIVENRRCPLCGGGVAKKRFQAKADQEAEKLRGDMSGGNALRYYACTNCGNMFDLDVIDEIRHPPQKQVLGYGEAAEQKE